MNVAFSAYDFYHEYDNETPKKVKLIIKELEEQMPNLPPAEQAILANKIAAIKAAAKTQALKNQGYNTGFEIVKHASTFGGPVLAGVATYVTHDHQNSINEQNNQIIGKAKIVGGRRVVKHRKTKNAKSSALQQAAVAALFLGAYNLSGIEPMKFVADCWNGIKSLF